MYEGDLKMKWWYYLLLFLIILIIIIICIICFRNSVVQRKEDIENAKSEVRILKAKYLQVLRKTGKTQLDSNIAQGYAYQMANENGGGEFIGGAIGPIRSNFKGSSKLVQSLADEYQRAQQRLNYEVKSYNIYITAFPRVILSKMFGYKKENYVDNDNLDASTKLNGFDENDI